MAFQIFLTDDASRDLEELYDYIASHDAPGKADYVLDQIEKAFSSLSENPERGAYPKELLAALEGVGQDGDLVIFAGAGDIGQASADIAARIAREAGR